MSASVKHEIIQLVVADLVTDHNNRRTDQEIQETSTSIKTVGLLNPILVRQIGEHKTGPKKGQPIFRVVCGHRRTESYLLLAQESEKSAIKYATIAATVIAGEDVDECYARLTDNTARVNLSITELGWSAYELRTTYGQKVTRIADKIGKSREHVSNCLGVVEKVHKRILDAYDSGETTLTSHDLFELKTKTQEEQIQLFEAMTATEDPDADPVDPATPRDPNRPKIPSKKKIEAVFLHLDALPTPTVFQQGARDALAWVLKGGECPFPVPVPEPVAQA